MTGGPHGQILDQAGAASDTTIAAGDKWDAMPLLVVDSLELRKLLGMAADQKWIAPRDLQQARLESPRTRRPTTFMLWAQQLVFKPENELSPLEKGAWNSSTTCGPTRTIVPAGTWRSCPCPVPRKNSGSPWSRCCA